MRKQVAQGRQAYLVYPVIEGTKDDQPELDFARDEIEEQASESASRPDQPIYVRVSSQRISRQSQRRRRPQPGPKARLLYQHGALAAWLAQGKPRGLKARPIEPKSKGIPKPEKLFAEKTKLRSATEIV